MNEAGLLSLTLYGPANALFTIIFVGPYREYTLKLLKPLRRMLPFILKNRVVNKKSRVSTTSGTGNGLSVVGNGALSTGDGLSQNNVNV
jgi:hypothetical protein